MIRFQTECIMFLLTFFDTSVLRTVPDSLMVRASAPGVVGRGFAPRSRHTKGVKNGTSRKIE